MSKKKASKSDDKLTRILVLIAASLEILDKVIQIIGHLLE